MNLELRNKFILIVFLTVLVVLAYNQINWDVETFLPDKVSELFSQIKVKPFNKSEKIGRFVSEKPLYEIVSQSDRLQITSLTQNSSESPLLIIDDKELLSQKVKKRFYERKMYLKKQCSVLPLTENKNYYKYFLQNRMFYEPIHNFFVCLVAKSAASTWRDHLTNIKKKHKTKKRKKISKTENEIISLSNGTVKVMTVRHPIQRLISAYRDKFGDGLEAPSTSTKKYWYDAAENQLKTSLGVDGNRSIAFDSFVHLVVKGYFKTDRHFRSVYSNCVPCKIDYDFIVHQETFSEDLLYLFHVLDVTESTIDLRVNESRNRTVERRPTELYLKELKQEQLVAIYDLLWTDFFLFDYPLPDSLLDSLKQKGRKLFMKT